MKTVDLAIPKALTGDWTMEWWTEDRSTVEAGQPIGIAHHAGERFLAIAPETGTLRINLNEGFRVADSAMLLAQILVGVAKSVSVSREVGMDKKEQWLQKLDPIIKKAVKPEFDALKASVKAEFATVNGRINAVETRLGTVEGRIRSVEQGVNDIKKHFGIP